MGIVPSPRQRVFPFFGTLQLLPSSHTSLKWYLFPKTAIQFSKYGLPASDSLPAFRRLARRSFHHHYSSTAIAGKQGKNYYNFVTACYIFNKMPFLYIYVCHFLLSLYGVQFQAFCITIFYVNSLYGVFGRSA